MTDRAAWERLDAELRAARDGAERRRILYRAMDMAERALQHERGVQDRAGERAEEHAACERAQDEGARVVHAALVERTVSGSASMSSSPEDIGGGGIVRASRSSE